MDFILKFILVIIFTNNAQCFLLLPLLGASLYQAYLEQGLEFRENPFLGNKPILAEYDFVIIGAGPGGCVVANRLSEIQNWKILLLEAGEDENIYTDIPALVSKFHHTGYNWGYRAERTGNACLAQTDQRCPWPRGKGMGGSSIINYMIYTRGNAHDYDGYARDGNVGWSYNDVLPYFLKSENNSIPEYTNSKYHAHNGYLHVEWPRHKSILVDAFLKGGHELGYKTIDYNEPKQYGFSRVQATTRYGKRMSASKAFLRPIKFRKNLHISILSRATKLLIDPKTKRAYGVEFVKNGRKRVVRARKEVILSAGALNSPQLLMLSGIGPSEELKRFDIPVLRDAKVGENLNEHYSTIGLSFVVNQTRSSLHQNYLGIESFLDWLKYGKGLMTLPGGVEGLGYVSTKYNKQPKDYPDLEYIFLGASIASDNGGALSKSFGISECFYDQIFRYANNRDTWAIVPMLLHPKSKGRILLRDRNPFHAPLFKYDYFSEEEDLNVLVEGVKEILRLAETEAFRRLGTILNPSRLPQCTAIAPYGSDAYWACFVRYFTGTLHHQCGTCKMGPATDSAAVVDPQLRVYGIEGLRVIDSSIFPRVPGAHLYAPTLMVGEKGADMIKATWLRSGDNQTTTWSYEEFVRTSVAPCLQNGTEYHIKR